MLINASISHFSKAIPYDYHRKLTRIMDNQILLEAVWTHSQKYLSLT